jgi:two-component system, chemotaxis family, sensor kinase CheA
VEVLTEPREESVTQIKAETEVEDHTEIEETIEVTEIIEPIKTVEKTENSNITKITAPAEEAGFKKIKTNTSEDSIRVNVSLLNTLLNLASELVLGRNQLLRGMEMHRKNITGMDSILQNIDHITTELQEKVMQTRMQSIANVFNKFPRIIRDMAKKMNKEIDLIIEGDDVELDKSIIEALGDPLTHLIRNAVDHGLETPTERKKAGKPEVGKVIMKAYHESGYVNVDIIDDGRGLDLEKIKKKAIEKGIIDKNELLTMKENDITQLVFNPGFSTAEVVTDFSGRGVGMDVVKTNIEKLGGAIEIFTVPQKGTTFRLLLPLTLAIIPSIIVEVEGQKFALPQINLQEIVRIKSGDAHRKIEFINSSEVLRLRGGLLPIIHLGDVLGIKRTYLDTLSHEKKVENRKTITGYSKIIQNENEEAQIIKMKREVNSTIRILVIKIGSKKLGIITDKIHGSEEILVKPMPAFIKDCRCYSGVTIMGDGKTAMILDPEGIIGKANLNFTDVLNQKGSERNVETTDENIMEHQSILIFKCSGTETLAVDLSMVSRVEEISPNDIEVIGDTEYIKYRGDMLRVIKPENYLPISKGKAEAIPKKYYVIIPKLVRHPIGLLIEKIHDTVHTVIKLNSENTKIKGILGSSIINDKIVVLLNLYELFEIVNPDNYSLPKGIANEKLTILVAEDTPFFQKLERDYLLEAGYKVITAENGKVALELLYEHHVDVVISDIKMPVMDGIELVKRIRSDKKLSHLPVIALTSMTGDTYTKVGLEAGFDIYEYKLDRSRLLSVIEKAISDRRLP